LAGDRDLVPQRHHLGMNTLLLRHSSVCHFKIRSMTK
jgi:hypothetical protein